MSTDIQTQEIRIGKRATIVIPAAMRKALGIGEGDRVQATVCDGRLTLTPIPADPWERLRKAFAGVYTGVDVQAYVRGVAGRVGRPRRFGTTGPWRTDDQVRSLVRSWGSRHHVGVE